MDLNEKKYFDVDISNASYQKVVHPLRLDAVDKIAKGYMITYQNRRLYRILHQ